SYWYRVRASDAAANLGAYSNIATATTQTPPDTVPPNGPIGITATPSSATRIDLSWAAATDNVGVAGYWIERCQVFGCSNFAHISNTSLTTFSDTGLAASTSYSYRVRASDAAGNLGAYSSPATASTPAASGIAV